VIVCLCLYSESSIGDCMSVCLFLCLSVCANVCVCVCLCLSVSVCDSREPGRGPFVSMEFLSKVLQLSSLVQVLVLEAVEEWVAEFEPHAAARRRSAAQMIRNWAGEDAMSASCAQVETGLASLGLARRGARALFECALGSSMTLARMRDSYRLASPRPNSGEQAEVESEVEWLLASAEVDSEDVAAVLENNGENPPRMDTQLHVHELTPKNNNSTS
jgi:hypothetical protein